MAAAYKEGVIDPTTLTNGTSDCRNKFYDDSFGVFTYCAGRWGKMRYITFPALQNTILTVLILNLAKVMNLFESAFVMQNDAVLGTANVLETYIYYQTFNSGAIPNYGYTTAVGLFKSLVGCVLVLFCNHLSKKVRDGRGIV